MAWTLVGRATITGADLKVDVGQVDLPASGALEVRVKQISPPETSLFRAGLVYVVTPTGGRELGTRKFWGHLEGEDVVLGSAGQVDAAGTGRLMIEPRTANVKLLRSPASIGPWVLDVWVRPLVFATGGGGTTPTPTPEPTPEPTPTPTQTAHVVAVDSGPLSSYSTANINFREIFDATLGNYSANGGTLVLDRSVPFNRLRVRAAHWQSRRVYLNGHTLTNAFSSEEAGSTVDVTSFVPEKELVSVGLEMDSGSSAIMYAIWIDDIMLLDGHHQQPTLTFDTDQGLQYLKRGDYLAQAHAAGDINYGRGVVESVNVTNRTVTFAVSEGVWRQDNLGDFIPLPSAARARV